ncbi:Uncharacterised protein [Vibrio cholerae]|nr:Uncharacterised protein [Vibrio cholerae]CSI88803.1 Uncharacterised protein [Vibrio cholerae]
MYCRFTVAGVAISPIALLAIREAGLIAGTTPTTGIVSLARNTGNTMVLAVLQAMTTRSIRSCSTIRVTSVSTRAISVSWVSSP